MEVEECKRIVEVLDLLDRYLRDRIKQGKWSNAKWSEYLILYLSLYWSYELSFLLFSSLQFEFHDFYIRLYEEIDLFINKFYLLSPLLLITNLFHFPHVHQPRIRSSTIKKQKERNLSLTYPLQTLIQHRNQLFRGFSMHRQPHQSTAENSLTIIKLQKYSSSPLFLSLPSSLFSSQRRTYDWIEWNQVAWICEFNFEKWRNICEVWAKGFRDHWVWGQKEKYWKKQVRKIWNSVISVYSSRGNQFKNKILRQKDLTHVNKPSPKQKLSNKCRISCQIISQKYSNKKISQTDNSKRFRNDSIENTRDFPSTFFEYKHLRRKPWSKDWTCFICWKGKEKHSEFNTNAKRKNVKTETGRTKTH